MTQIDLTSCDKEKVHLINTIQGHGAFLGVMKSDLKIVHVSENVTSFFDMPEPAKMKISEKLNTVFPHELFRMIQFRLRGNVIFPFSLTWKNLDLYLYEIEENLVGIEIEKLPEPSEVEVDPAEITKTFLESMREAKDVSELSLHACRAVRSLTGMSRVMMYRFYPPTMYGEVIAEDRSAGAHSFANHRFPATDIPKPARDLYLRNQVRLIHDSHEKTVNIYPGQNKKGNLDMSDSRLRGVSNIHIEYLKNMGVRGSFSLAVKVEDKLWGLIACHNDEPTLIPHQIRSHCETIANSLALSAPLLEKTLEQQAEINFNSKFTKIFLELKDTIVPFEELFKRGTEINRIFRTEGFAVVSHSKVNAFGMTPLSADIQKLAEWINQQLNTSNKTIFVTESLALLEKDWAYIKDHASGVIAVRLNDYDESLFMLFRPEILQTVQWGGDPRKNFEQRNYQGEINPRASFETWSEVIKNNSLSWLQHEIEGAKNFKEMMFGAIIRKNDLIFELREKLQKRS